MRNLYSESHFSYKRIKVMIFGFHLIDPGKRMVTGCVDLHQSSDSSVRIPPPVPSKSNRHQRRHGMDAAPGLGNSSVSTATRDMWDRLFNDGYKADVVIYTDNGSIIYAHANIIVSSPSNVYEKC